MKTLLLDPLSWDLIKDAAGGIAVANSPYTEAQDAASAIKLFAGEYWYDTTLGTPYFSTTLGKQPPLQLLKAQFIAAAKTVPGVTAARCFLSAIQNRQVSGQVQITTATGQSAVAQFSR